MFVLLRDVSFSYDSRPVFSRLSLTFGRGWTALIGPNGCGKSTLLKLISGELTPDSGGISAPNTRVCPQDMDTAPLCFSDPDILNTPALFAMAARLGIGDDSAERWDTLSGGEKKRCIIADALIRKPEVLILDEPANHIDAYTTDLLYKELSRFEGAGIIVSHSLDFLDRLCAATVILEPDETGSRAVLIAAPPAAALTAREEEQNFLREQKRVLSASVKTLTRARKDAVREAAEEKRSRMSKSHLDIHDSDTRAKVNLARLSGRDRVGGKKVLALESVLERKRSGLEGLHVKGLRKTGALLRGRRLERPALFTLPSGVAVIAGNTLTLRHPALEIPNDARIVLTGGNGFGKTSFVEYILSAISLPPRSIWYLRQELSVEDRAEALRRLRSLNDEERGAALSVVYRLGSEPEALLATQNLSPGEARKLLFAFAMLQGAAFIVLDEPTNHLDAIAVDAFAGAINDFAGAALIVTHDRFFAKKTGKTEWRLYRDNEEARLEIHTL
jgi:ATPase subunit of ABC transporter with duplicated ATPase domains